MSDRPLKKRIGMVAQPPVPTRVAWPPRKSTMVAAAGLREKSRVATIVSF